MNQVDQVQVRSWGAGARRLQYASCARSARRARGCVLLLLLLMMMMLWLLLPLLLDSACIAAAAAAAAIVGGQPPEVFDVVQHGAVGDGATSDTAAVRGAAAALAQAGGGILRFPARSDGRAASYLTGPVNISSNTRVEIQAGATILGSQNGSEYPLLTASAVCLTHICLQLRTCVRRARS
eukprot:COSAG02_NODE_10129_length_2014_cov_7.665405_1_plen_181_part_00